MNTPLSKAIDALGSAAEMARLCGPTPQAVNGWKKRGAPPPEHCPAIERATGVRCEELRPDFDWIRDQAGEVTAYQVRVS